MTQPAAHRRGVTGDHTARGVPHGVTSLTPYIGVPDVPGAIEFYREVLRARTVEVTERDGVVVHAQLDLGNGHLHLEAPNPESGLSAPHADGTACYSFGFYCEDLGAVLSRARAAGAEMPAPPMDFASGDRFVAVTDPYGVRWSIISRVEDLSETDSADRIAAWASQA